MLPFWVYLFFVCLKFVGKIKGTISFEGIKKGLQHEMAQILRMGCNNLHGLLHIHRLQQTQQKERLASQARDVV
jgi:hypothetical protein